MFKKLFSRSQRKDGHKKRQAVTRVRRTEGEALRRFRLSRELAIERLVRQVHPRDRESWDEQRGEQFRKRIRKERLPFIGLRSQRELESGRQAFRSFQKVYQVMKDPMTLVPGVGVVCRQRAKRREQLFRMKVAGRGFRRAPGQGGTYRRNVDSETTCRVVRR